MRIVSYREPDVVVEMAYKEFEMFNPRGGLIIESYPESSLAIWLTHTGHLVLIIKRREEDEGDAGERDEAVP